MYIYIYIYIYTHRLGAGRRKLAGSMPLAEEAAHFTKSCLGRRGRTIISYHIIS